MKSRFILFATLVVIIASSCSKKMIPDKPVLAATDFKLDSLPNSELNIPIQINLKPIYALAEKKIDTLFTSPNYPNDWVQSDCATRYKYSFRRGPLTMKTTGNSLNMSFMGFYKIIGSTRVCAGGAVISPWTPPCSCGFAEGERRVNVSFTNSVSLQRDYKLLLNIKREEPQPIDKCQVCFWGQDITNEVMKGLKDELDGAKKAIDDSFGVVDLKPRLQQVWDKMNQAYHLYNMGWLQINPQRIHLDNFYAQNDSLNIFIGLSAKPVISFEKPKDQYSRLPDVMSFGNRPGFTIFLDAVLDYDSLSNVVNAQIRDKSFDLDKGPVKKKFIVKDCQLYGTNNEKMVIKVTYGGSENGVAYFVGKPVYDEKTRVIEIKDLDFDVYTKDFLVKSAGWIFNRRIVNEIRKYTRFDLSSYLDSAKVNVNQQLNREIYKGITSYGNIDEIKLLGVYPFSGHLVVRSNCSGSLAIKVDAVDFNF